MKLKITLALLTAGGALLIGGCVLSAGAHARGGGAPAAVAGGGSQTTQPPIPGFPSAVDPAAMDKTALLTNRWQLFLHLAANGGAERSAPLWEAWDTKCSLDLSPLCSAPAGNAQDAPRFATIFYSPAAAHFLRAEGLGQGATLQKILLAAMPSSSATQPPSPTTRFDLPNHLPSDSVVVKEIWEAFPLGEGIGDSQFLNLYDPNHPQFAQRFLFNTTQLQPAGNWPETPVLMKGGKPDESSPCQPSYASEAAVPLSCFHHVVFPSRCTPYFQKKSPIVGGGPLGSGGCVLVLVGLHLITRESGHWNWSTFWWTNDPGHVAADAGSGLPKPAAYSHFVLQTTFAGRLADGSQDFTYNPYLEGNREKGMVSNCAGCHGAAHYDPYCRAGAPCENHATGMGLQGAGAEVDPVHRRPVTATPPCVLRDPPGGLPCLLRTDSLWSLATGQDGSTNQPL